MEEISETEFRSAYMNRDNNSHKWINRGKKYNRVIKHFLSSDIAKYDAYEYDLRCLKIKSNLITTSYLVQDTAAHICNAYYLNGKSTDATVMFGIGDIDNDHIYYASPDYDCDQHLWCRWYSFTDGKISILAELEDKSFEYDLAEYELPSFFADNKGSYYIVINKNPNIFNDIGVKTYYKIQLIKRE